MYAIGLMSGTSLDGIDAALIETDGISVRAFVASHYIPYDLAMQNTLLQLLRNPDKDEAEVEREMTLLHAKAVKELLVKSGKSAKDIRVAGFHGQTIWHKPNEGKTKQIGDGMLLAQETGISVVNDMRSNDMRHGGQGAPLVPLYHEALVRDQKKPVAIVNIGGVANITWIGKDEHQLQAFDTGPGNALINDWVRSRLGVQYDAGGAFAGRGKPRKDLVARLMSHPYFLQQPPKSLDRNSFSILPLEQANLSPNDGTATLTAFTAESIVAAAKHFPEPATAWYICGGGRHNVTLMRWIEERLTVPVAPIEKLGCNGDMIEAEAFAFLAVRTLEGLPLTLPCITGVKEPVSGGVLYNP
jgi:anhydro-N-acetylmuramic acid kinase